MELTGWTADSPWFPPGDPLWRNWRYRIHDTGRDLVVADATSDAVRYVQLPRDTFIALVQYRNELHLRTLPTSFRDEYGKHILLNGTAWTLLVVVAISSRMSHAMQRKYCHMRGLDPMIWVTYKHQLVAPLANDVVNAGVHARFVYRTVAFTIRTHVPTACPGRHKYHRQHPRWCIINGGHLQRCTAAVMMVETVAPFRVLVHRGNSIDTYWRVWRIVISAQGELVINNEYRVLYDGLHALEPDRIEVVGSSDNTVAAVPRRSRVCARPRTLARRRKN